MYIKRLYIFWFLHQTTTWRLSRCLSPGCISFDSYIKPQRVLLITRLQTSCISFDSYIKPQQDQSIFFPQIVVYLLIPTSNHNNNWGYSFPKRLYIFWFLHQTTTSQLNIPLIAGCISFDSYIKPQPAKDRLHLFPVVYLLIPTSNHNLCDEWAEHDYVVYLLIPTSNHNCPGTNSGIAVLYIFWFLHQTTTPIALAHSFICCISFDSYIKPQPSLCCHFSSSVVYLLIPTSNHNCA